MSLIKPPPPPPLELFLIMQSVPGVMVEGCGEPEVGGGDNESLKEWFILDEEETLDKFIVSEDCR